MSSTCRFRWLLSIPWQRLNMRYARKYIPPKAGKTKTSIVHNSRTCTCTGFSGNILTLQVPLAAAILELLQRQTPPDAIVLAAALRLTGAADGSLQIATTSGASLPPGLEGLTVRPQSTEYR